MEKEKNYKGQFERSIETQVILDKLIEVSVGQTITYEEMSKVVGFNIQENRWPLNSARDIMFNQYGAIFEAIIDIGLKRAEDSSIVSVVMADFNRVRRFAKKRKKMLQCVDFSQLENNEKIKHNAGLSLYGILEYVTKTRQVKKLEYKIKDIQQALPISKTLEYFQQ